MNKRQLIAFENKVAKLWERGKIRVPVHFCGGNEDELIEIFKGIKRQDYVFSTHRNHYHYLLHTGNKDALVRELMGRSTGICGGQSGSMHTIDYANRFYASGIVAGCVAIAAGVGVALKLSGSRRKAYCFVGDGATDEGWFWEAVRYVHGHDLPVTFVIEDNNRSVCTNKMTRWGVYDQFLFDSPHIIHYRYTPHYPHVGTHHQIQW